MVMGGSGEEVEESVDGPLWRVAVWSGAVMLAVAAFAALAAWVILVIWAVRWWHLTFEWLALIGGVLRDGVALGEIGKPVGFLMDAALRALWLTVPVIGGVLLGRWYWRGIRVDRGQRLRLALAERRAEARAAAAEPDGGFDAAYDDMVDALERAHELMARGEVKQARHEIERALEAA